MDKKDSLTFLIVALAIIVIGCKEKAPSNTVSMSEGFGLCIDLPKGVAYRLDKRIFDYETGHLENAGAAVDVYIGYQPPYEGNSWPRGKEKTNGFVLAGRGKWGGTEKILLGSKQQEHRGPLFVMFSGADLRAAEQILLKKDLISSCNSRSK